MKTDISVTCMLTQNKTVPNLKAFTSFRPFVRERDEFVHNDSSGTVFVEQMLSSVMFLVCEYLYPNEILQLSFTSCDIRSALKGTALRLDLLLPRKPCSTLWLRKTFSPEAQWSVKGAFISTCDEEFFESHSSTHTKCYGSKSSLSSLLEDEIINRAMCESLIIRPFQYSTVECFAKCPKLRTLKLLSCERLRGPFSPLSNCKYLEEIYINSFELRSINGLELCTSLKKISLVQCDLLSDIKAFDTGNLQQLSTLSLVSCPSLTSIDFIGGIQNLKSLTVISCVQLTNGISVLRSMKKLSTITWNNPSIDFNFEEFSYNLYLQQFSASLCCFYDLRFLEGIKNLIELNCENSTDMVSVNGIEHCPQLRALNLNYCRELRYIQSIAKCTKLEKVSLKGCFRLNARVLNPIIVSLMSHSLKCLEGACDLNLRSITVLRDQN